MKTPNPLLGNVSPIEMIKMGNDEKLCKFILNQLDENGPFEAKAAHTCKCRNGEEGAMTVKVLDEGLCQCPRCGGIIVTKAAVSTLADKHTTQQPRDEA